MTERVITDGDILDLKARLGAAMDEWVEGLELLEDPAPETPPGEPRNPAATPGDGVIVLTWEAPAIPPGGQLPIGYRYGRDGTDASGGGPWSGVLPADARTATLDRLVNGRTYRVTLAAVYPTGDVGVSVTVTPTGPPPAPVPAAWTSGVWAAHNRQDAVDFLAWRGGSTPTNVTMFVARETETKAMSPWWQAGVPAGSRLSLRIPLVPDNDRDLTKRRDMMFRTIALQAADVDPNAYVCPGWEMNLGNWAWAVTPANLAAWRAAWARCYDTMKAVAPGLLIGWNPNGGGDQTGVDVRKSFVDAKVDFVGVDQYDCWPGVTSGANATLMRTRPGGLDYWADFARSKKTRLALPEWGCSVGTQWAGHTGGDNPAYIREIAAYRQRNADIWLYDSYFNEPASYVRSDIWQPAGKTPSNPKAAATYRELFGG